MPEFTLKLDPSLEVLYLKRQIEASKANVVTTKLNERAGYYYLTVDVQTVQITVYLGLVSLIAVSFGVFYFGFSAWLYLLPSFLLFMTLLGSSYYWILMVSLRLRRLGYQGKLRIAHAEGVF